MVKGENQQVLFSPDTYKCVAKPKTDLLNLVFPRVWRVFNKFQSNLRSYL